MAKTKLRPVFQFLKKELTPDACSITQRYFKPDCYFSPRVSDTNKFDLALNQGSISLSTKLNYIICGVVLDCTKFSQFTLKRYIVISQEKWRLNPRLTTLTSLTGLKPSFLIFILYWHSSHSYRQENWNQRSIQLLWAYFADPLQRQTRTRSSLSFESRQIRQMSSSLNQ